MIELTEPLTEEQANTLCRSIADRVVALGLASPAIFALEMHRPLSRLAGQAMVAATPVLAPVFGVEGVGNVSRLLYHPGGVDMLVRAIEERADRSPRRTDSTAKEKA